MKENAQPYELATPMTAEHSEFMLNHYYIDHTDMQCDSQLSPDYLPNGTIRSVSESELKLALQFSCDVL